MAYHGEKAGFPGKGPAGAGGGLPGGEEEAVEERYIAFDVETPNGANDRMSAIGVTVVENGVVVGTWDTLVTPETWFDRFNIRLTGITPERAAGGPAFPALWRELAPVFESGVLAAHNAPFDLAVLARCLKAYGIRWRPLVPYVCTCQLSRRLLPQLPDHKLSTLCAYLGLELDHHRAGSDSLACGEILARHLRSGARMEAFTRLYDLERVHTVRRS